MLFPELLAAGHFPVSIIILCLQLNDRFSCGQKCLSNIRFKAGVSADVVADIGSVYLKIAPVVYGTEVQKNPFSLHGFGKCKAFAVPNDFVKTGIFYAGQFRFAGIRNNDCSIEGFFFNREIPFSVQAKPVVPSKIGTGVFASG